MNSLRRPALDETKTLKRTKLSIASLVLGILAVASPLLGVLVGFLHGRADFGPALVVGLLLASPLASIAGVVLGTVALLNVRRDPSVYGGRGVAVAGVLISGLAAVATFVILTRPASHPRIPRNEALAIANIRTLISAEKMYAAANGGLFDTVQCLAAPRDCIPGYPVESSSFLEGYLVREERTYNFGGYERTFFAGLPAELTDSQRAVVSPSSLTSFAYVAVPINPGLTGVRSFCGDSTGRICFAEDGSVPRISDGLCPANWKQVE